MLKGCLPVLQRWGSRRCWSRLLIAVVVAVVVVVVVVAVVAIAVGWHMERRVPPSPLLLLRAVMVVAAPGDAGTKARSLVPSCCSIRLRMRPP
jgi:peptidoglycan/LPS O-acetylase OafA/YrhL